MRTVKNFLLIVIAMVTLSLVGCSKADEFEEDSSLDGTEWVCNDLQNDMVGTLKFQKTTFSLYYEWEENGKKITNGGSGTYEYNHPNVLLKADGETLNLVLSGNKMSLAGVVFVKK